MHAHALINKTGVNLFLRGLHGIRIEAEQECMRMNNNYCTIIMAGLSV